MIGQLTHTHTHTHTSCTNIYLYKNHILKNVSKTVFNYFSFKNTLFCSLSNFESKSTRQNEMLLT